MTETVVNPTSSRKEDESQATTKSCGRGKLSKGERRRRKQAMSEKKGKKGQASATGNTSNSSSGSGSSGGEEEEDELDAVDDWSSAWRDVREKGERWGGRGKGRRGIQRNTWQPKDVWIEGVTLAYLRKCPSM